MTPAGEAAYWTLRVGDREARNAAWSYPRPLPKDRRFKAPFIGNKWMPGVSDPSLVKGWACVEG